MGVAAPGGWQALVLDEVRRGHQFSSAKRAPCEAVLCLQCEGFRTLLVPCPEELESRSLAPCPSRAACPLLGATPSGSRGPVPARLVITTEQSLSRSCLGTAPAAPPGAELSTPFTRAAQEPASHWLCLSPRSEGQNQPSCHCVMGLLSLSCLPALLRVSVHCGFLSGFSQLLFSKCSAHVFQLQVEQLINCKKVMLTGVWLCLISATEFTQTLLATGFYCRSEEGLTVLPIRIISYESNSSV